MTVTGPPSDGHRVDQQPWAALLDEGMVTLPEALASVDEATRASGDRVLILRVAGGLSLDVLLDRGLDIGAAWWNGIPLAWRSPNLVDPGPGRGWEDRFLGGLLATCGPDNIGPPRAGRGQHGTHHLTRAHDVRWWREHTVDGVEVHVGGTVAGTQLNGRRVLVEREIVTGTGAPFVEVRDTVSNRSDQPVAIPLLYHVNVGAPMLRPGARLQVDSDGHRLRHPCPAGREPLVVPAPEAGAEAVVAEHLGVRSDEGWARAVLDTSWADGRLVVGWNVAVLPRLFTWNWPARGAWVLGVEPANSPMFGPERKEPHGGAPLIGPGEEFRTVVRIGVQVPRGTASRSLGSRDERRDPQRDAASSTNNTWDIR